MNASHEAEDLALWATTTGQFYSDVAQPMIWAIARHMAVGTHDEAKARGAWERVADTAARMYIAERARKGERLAFTRAHRAEAGELIAQHYAEELAATAARLTRAKKLNAVYRATHADFKGKLPDGTRTVLLLVPNKGTCLVPLDELPDEEIERRLPKANCA
jgi:hypothetical protein